MAHPVAERRGFTLVELLVALVISGILAAIILQLLQGQTRFTSMQSAREEVQQNARAVVELLGGELRGVPGGDALVQATADSVTVRVPRVWGVVCVTPTTSSRLQVVLASGGTDLTPTDSTGMVVELESGGTSQWSNPVRVTSVGSAASTCDGSALPAGAEMREITFAGSLVTSPMPNPAAGDPVYVYDPVTYRVGSSAGVEGLWVQRRSDGSGSQPFAGPLAEDGGPGLSFRYFATDGTELVPPLTEVSRTQVSSILLTVRTLSSRAGQDTPETQTDSVRIFLRNRSAP